jgi:hypothetical protein
MNNNIEIQVKRKNKLGAGRPKKYGEITAKENEKVSKYHQAYYHLTNKEINCELCGKKSTIRSLVKHKQSMKCQFISSKIQHLPLET